MSEFVEHKVREHTLHLPVQGDTPWSHEPKRQELIVQNEVIGTHGLGSLRNESVSNVSAEAEQGELDRSIVDMLDPRNVIELKERLEHTNEKALSEGAFNIDRTLDKDGSRHDIQTSQKDSIKNRLIEEYTQIGTTEDERREVPQTVKDDISRMLDMSFDELEQKITDQENNKEPKNIIEWADSKKNDNENQVEDELIDIPEKESNKSNESNEESIKSVFDEKFDNEDNENDDSWSVPEWEESDVEVNDSHESPLSSGTVLFGPDGELVFTEDQDDSRINGAIPLPPSSIDERVDMDDPVGVTSGELISDLNEPEIIIEPDDNEDSISAEVPDESVNSDYDKAQVSVNDDETEKSGLFKRPKAKLAREQNDKNKEFDGVSKEAKRRKRKILMGVVGAFAVVAAGFAANKALGDSDNNPVIENEIVEDTPPALDLDSDGDAETSLNLNEKFDLFSNMSPQDKEQVEEDLRKATEAYNNNQN